jgi:hypothetical protein
MLTDPRTRPTPLTALALVCLVAGAFLLLSGLSLVLVGGVLGMNGVQMGSTNDPLMAFVFGLVTIAVAAAYVTLYHGFWELRAWTFNAGFIVAGAGSFTVLAGLLFGYGDLGWALVNVVVGVAVMGVLLLPSSQQALGHAVADEPPTEKDAPADVTGPPAPPS